uniref:FBA_2 domain-containing protein n=1 Tax=Caenorhabditis tropicalis TaxID=1561998 RepID=A0A1I7UJ22_9PELO
MSWLNLTIRLRQHITELLDYESRCQLRLCSKDDRETVDSTRFIPSTFKISEFPSDMSNGKTIIRIDIDTFTMWFIGKENLTRIDRGWNGELIDGMSQIKQENRYELVNQFLQSWSHKGFIKCGSFELDVLEVPPPTTWKFKSNVIKIVNLSANYLEWIESCVPFNEFFKVMEILCWMDVAMTPVLSVLNVKKSLKVDQPLDLTDGQLERIHAPDLSISSALISVEGAKKRLEHFLKFGNKTDKMELGFSVPPNFNALEQLIPKHLVVKKLKKENEQEGEFYGKIFGGFENVNKVQDPREIDCMQYGNMIRLYCGLYEKSTRPCMMYPFYQFL